MPSNNLHFIKKIGLYLIQLFLNYVSYFFLTGSVILSLVVLIFIILNIHPTTSFDFLRFFSFINPIYKNETFELSIREVMQIFAIVTLVLSIIVSSIKFGLKKIFGVKILLSFKFKALLLFSIISLSYAVAFLIIGLTDSLDKEFYAVFAIFYIINLISASVYFSFDLLSKEAVKLLRNLKNK